MKIRLQFHYNSLKVVLLLKWGNMEMESNKIVLPALGALLAAIIGGVIWAAFGVISDYELGIIAWAIGGLAGYAVVLFSNRQTTQIHQVMAVIASLIGIVLGTFLLFS